MITIYQPLIQPSQFKKVTCDGHQVVTARELAKIKIVPSELQQLLSFDESLDDYLGWLRLVIKLVKRVKNFQHSIKSRILTFTSWFSFKKKVEISENKIPTAWAARSNAIVLVAATL